MPAFAHYICSFTVSTLSATLVANSPATSAHSASSGFFAAASPPTSNPDNKASRSRSRTRWASNTRFTSSTRTTARRSAPLIGSVPQRSGSCSSSITEFPPVVLDDDSDEDGGEGELLSQLAADANVGVQREVPPSLSDTSARSIASQMTSAVEGRVEHALGHAIVLQQQVMSILEVESAAEVDAIGEDEGE
jgi:hypothetical protein